MPDHRLFIGTARWDLSAAGRSSSCFIDTSVSSAAILDAIVYYYYKAGIGEQSFFWEEAKGRPKGEEEEKTGCGLDTHCRLRLLTRQCPPVPRPPARTPARPPCCDPPARPPCCDPPARPHARRAVILPFPPTCSCSFRSFRHHDMGNYARGNRPGTKPIICGLVRAPPLFAPPMPPCSPVNLVTELEWLYAGRGRGMRSCARACGWVSMLGYSI